MSPDDDFEAHRPRLLAVAYGMLGDRGEAEDIVQDAWLRWRATDPGSVRNPEAFLVTVTTRLAIDRFRAARARREAYVGPWLPEPVVTDPAAASPDPLARVLDSERLSLALLVALERLNPVERAVLLLRDVFDLDYAEVAAIVERRPDNCRQIARRARTRVADPARRAPVTAEDEQRIVAAFSAAALRGDLAALTAVLAADAVLFTDGGGVVVAARKPIFGASKIARFLLGVQRKVSFEPVYAFVRVNGDPGIRQSGPDGVVSLLALELDGDGSIANVRIVVNPHKLTRA